MFERTRHRDAEPSVVAAGKYEAEGEIAEVISSALEKESAWSRGKGARTRESSCSSCFGARVVE